MKGRVPVRLASRLARWAGCFGLALAATSAVVVGSAAPSVAGAEVHYPVDGQFTFTGHGFGHGRGMSQWGAYGAAQSGLNADQILSFYYPGTAGAQTGNPLVRAWIASGDNAYSDVPDPTAQKVSAVELTTVRTGPISVSDGTTVLALPSTIAGFPVSMWRAAATGVSYVLQGNVNGTWTNYPAPPLVTTGGMTFSSAVGWMSLVLPDGTQRDYLGSIAAVPTGPSLRTVNVVDRESYLKTVVPSEMPSSWLPAALQAQAVAARTYEASVANPANSYDICDTTSCQVYVAWRSYDASGALIRTAGASATDAAIAATAGQVRTSDGAPIFAQFSSSSGGWTVDGSRSYLPAQADPYDGVIPNSANSWTQVVSAAAIGASLGVGTVTSLTVAARDGHGEWGGRVTSVTVVGTTGRTTVSGEAFRGAAGLKSSWWSAPVGTIPWPAFSQTDLFALAVGGTTSGNVEVHVLSRSSLYSAFTAHSVSSLLQIPPSQLDDWRFLMAPWAGSGQPDLYAIHLRNTESGRLEVHVLSAASGYRTFVAHIASAQPALPAGQGVDVALSSYGGDLNEDLFLIPWSNTGSGQVEVHVLSGGSLYGQFLTHVATALPTAGVDATGWRFFVRDSRGAGDLVVVRTGGTTGSGTAELHVLSADSGYATWINHQAIPIALQAPGVSDWGFGDFDGDRIGDLFLIMKTGTGSGGTEVHVLSGKSGYQTFALHLASPLPTLPGANWQSGIG